VSGNESVHTAASRRASAAETVNECGNGHGVLREKGREPKQSPFTPELRARYQSAGQIKGWPNRQLYNSVNSGGDDEYLTATE
jgi:hypothetical protein